MFDRSYLKRLERDLADWATRGWVAPEARAAILADVAARSGRAERTPIVLALLGALAFGTGVILFFAANWSAMPKLAKLAVLFGGMWAVYAAAGVALMRATGVLSRLSPALLLLGAILFGANIALIAQIYHVSGDYSDSILLWAVGALAVVWLLQSQAVAVLGLLLTALWAVIAMSEAGRTGYLHWPFWIVWALFALPVLRQTWRAGAGAAMLAGIVWCVATLFFRLEWRPDRTSDAVYLLQVYALAGLGVCMLARLMVTQVRFSALAPVVERFALIGGFLAFYGLVLREFHGLGERTASPAPIDIGWGLATALALAAVGAAGLLWRRLSPTPMTLRAAIGLALVGGVILGIVLNLLPGFATASKPIVIYLGFNILDYALLVWLIADGHHAGDAFRVNTAFVFVALGAVTLYFDTFWGLMDRSFFFMGGGLLLFGGGYLLERQRRRLTRAIEGGSR